MGKISRYGDAGPGPNGSVMSVTFQIEGQEFFALNGRPAFQVHARHLLLRQLRKPNRK